jgi:hypothetical protein
LSSANGPEAAKRFSKPLKRAFNIVRQGKGYERGDFAGSLDEVRNNIRKAGAIDCCRFVSGWFDKTLPMFSREIVLVYIDVDLETSPDVCMRNL